MVDVNSTPDSLLLDKSRIRGTDSVSLANASGCDLSPQILRQTKTEIGAQLQQLAELSRQSLPIAEFYTSFLTKSLQMMMAEGVAVWQRASDGTWNSVAHINVDPALKFDREPTEENQTILECLQKDQQPVVIPPRSIPVQGELPINPTEQLLLCSPIPFSDSEFHLWLQVIQRPSGGAATHRGYLRFVAQLADLIADYLKSNRLQWLESERVFVRASETLLERLSNRPVVDDALRDLADTLCSVAGANQVFIVHRNPRSPLRWNIEIVSGIGKVDPRGEGAEVVLEFCRMAQRFQVEKSPRCTTFSDQERSIDPALDRYMELFSAKRVSYLPIDLAGVSLRNQELQQTSRAGLVIHWSNDLAGNPMRSAEQQEKNLVALARMSLHSIRPRWWSQNQLQGSTAPVSWRSPRSWPRWAQAGAVAFALGAIGILPIPLSLHASATLHPSQVQYLYAPSDSVVQEVLADHNDQLDMGSTVIRLQDRTLESNLDEAIGAQTKQMERIREVSNRLSRSEQLNALERDQLEGERLMLEQTMVTQRKKIELLEEQFRRLDLKSTQANKVGTWDLKRTLQGRPVRAGQLLGTLYSEDGDWFLEANFPERDWAMLSELESESIQATATLSSHPQILLKPSFMGFERQATADPQDPTQRVLRLRFRIAANQLPQLKEGATAQLRIECGHTPVAWVLLRDVMLTSLARIRLWL